MDDGDTLQARFLSLIDLEENDLARQLETSPGTSSYQVLKSSLLRRLINSVFLIDLRKSSQYNELAKARVENDRQLFAARTFSFLGLKEVAESISRRELAIAERFELTSNVIEFLTILVNGATISNDAVRLKAYREKQGTWLAAYLTETEMSGRLSELLIKFAKKGADNPAIRDSIFNLAFDAERHARLHNTFKLGLIAYRLKAIAYQVSGEYRKCLGVCREAEDFIQSKIDFNTPTRVAEFELKRLVCSMHLRDREAGLKASAQCLEVYSAGSYNWFVAMEYTFLLHMITLDFDAAALVHRSALAHDAYSQLDDFLKERWSLYELYLLYAQGGLSTSHKLKFRKDVEYKDFLKYIPSYSADKAGFNMSVLVLHILYLVDTKNFEAIHDRIDALQTYRNRYLKGRSQQADTFIQLLSLLTKAGLYHREIRKHTEELASKLQADDDGHPVVEGVQILPFEWIWQKILTSLPRN